MTMGRVMSKKINNDHSYGNYGEVGADNVNDDHEGDENNYGFEDGDDDDDE